MEVIQKLQGTMRRLLRRETPATRTSSRSDVRRARRVGVGMDARLKIRDDKNVLCEVTDATADGVRLNLSERLAPGMIAIVEIPFNGRRLRTGVQIRWTRDRLGRVEVGGSFLKGADEGTIKNFDLYLRWCEAFHRAA